MNQFDQLIQGFLGPKGGSPNGYPFHFACKRGGHVCASNSLSMILVPCDIVEGQYNDIANYPDFIKTFDEAMSKADKYKNRSNFIDQEQPFPGESKTGAVLFRGIKFPFSEIDKLRQAREILSSDVNWVTTDSLYANLFKLDYGVWILIMPCPGAQID